MFRAAHIDSDNKLETEVRVARNLQWQEEFKVLEERREELKLVKKDNLLPRPRWQIDKPDNATDWL